MTTGRINQVTITRELATRRSHLGTPQRRRPVPSLAVRSMRHASSVRVGYCGSTLGSSVQGVLAGPCPRGAPKGLAS